jgi:hypothetical protein
MAIIQKSRAHNENAGTNASFILELLGIRRDNTHTFQLYLYKECSYIVAYIAFPK